MHSIIFAAMCAIAQIAISVRIAKQAAKREIEKAALANSEAPTQ